MITNYLLTTASAATVNKQQTVNFATDNVVSGPLRVCCALTVVSRTFAASTGRLPVKPSQSAKFLKFMVVPRWPGKTPGSHLGFCILFVFVLRTPCVCPCLSRDSLRQAEERIALYLPTQAHLLPPLVLRQSFQHPIVLSFSFFFHITFLGICLVC